MNMAHRKIMPFRKMVIEIVFLFVFNNVRSKLNDTCFFLGKIPHRWRPITVFSKCGPQTGSIDAIIWELFRNANSAGHSP